MTAEHDPLSTLRTRLREAVELPDPSFMKLCRLLEGYDFPPIGHEDEPFLPLIRAASRGDADANRMLQTKLALCLMALLHTQPDSTRSPRLLYNLIKLCAVLERAYLLVELRAMQQRGVLKERGATYAGITLDCVLHEAIDALAGTDQHAHHET